MVWTTLTAASFAVSPWLGEAPALFSTLLSSLLHAERLPVTMQQRGFHPIIIAGLVTVGLSSPLRLFPRYRAALEERGRLMLDAARPAEALAAFEALLSLAPEQARVRARS